MEDNTLERMLAEYNERFQPHEYRKIFYAPSSGEGRVEGLFPDGYFESARLLLQGITSGELREGIEGVPAVFLCRHYLELAIKYTLFHSRWLKTERENAADSEIEPVRKGHDLQCLWNTLTTELEKRAPNIARRGLDLPFVGRFVAEFQAVDPVNERFRYSGVLLGVPRSYSEKLNVDFDALLFNLQLAHDVLDALDTYLIETHGENEEWQQILNGL